MSPWPASSPSIEIFSSIASQWIPRRLSSKSWRCAGVAWSRRGNHASGTPSVRPSSISTHMQSSSKRSALGEILTPALSNCSRRYLTTVGMRHLCGHPTASLRSFPQTSTASFNEALPAEAHHSFWIASLRPMPATVPAHPCQFAVLPVLCSTQRADRFSRGARLDLQAPRQRQLRTRQSHRDRSDQP